MKTKQKVAILALAALITGTSHAAITGKSSGFMDKRQLAEWRAETASKSAETEENATGFFTGKPYLVSLDTYAFRFRNYDPNIARWTSEDPIGFPDGANGSFYAPVPTSQLDSMGLFLSGTAYAEEADDKAMWMILKAFGGLQATAMGYADNTTTGNWTLDASEISKIRMSDLYQDRFIKSVQDLLGASPSLGAFSSPENNMRFSKPSEPYYAFGEARFSTSGTVSAPLGTWDYNATVVFSDHYSFSLYASAPWYTPTALGYRLEFHGFLRAYDINGSWNGNWYE